MFLNNKIITGLTFILLGGFVYINRTGYINLSTQEIIGISFLFYGIPSVYISLNEGRRHRLFASAVLFFVGIIFIVESKFELMDTRGFVFASILFIGGAVFLILYIENIKERVFLAAAIILMLLGYASTTIFKQFGILNTANKIAGIVDNYWSLILFFLGLNIFLTRKNNRFYLPKDPSK